VRSRLELRVYPHILISQFREELVSDLFIIFDDVIDLPVLLDKG